jgi:hypothetical protein
LIFTDPPCMHDINGYPQYHDGTFKTFTTTRPEGETSTVANSRNFKTGSLTL